MTLVANNKKYFKNNVINLFFMAIMTFGSAGSAFAQSMATPAAHAIIVDGQTGTVLFEKAADEPFPPASMAKLMTIYLAFDALRDERISLSDPVSVSDDAWRDWNKSTGRIGKGGSTMWLRARDEVTVEQLLKGIIVNSGNDACVVLAEHMAGSHEVFVQWMNDAAFELGLKESVFKNSVGWPAEGQVMSARDLATLSQLLATEFPTLYPMFSERQFIYNPEITFSTYNRNPLLGNFPGADGLKTGYTSEAGYGLAASAERDGRRVVVVVAGLGSERERQRESRRLMQHAFRNFDLYPLFRAGETVDHAEVWLGQTPTVPLVVKDDIRLTLSRRERSRMQVQVAYTNPVPAPLLKGQKAGELIVNLPDKNPLVFDLLAGAAVSEVGGFGRIGAALEYLIFGTAGSTVPAPAAAE